MKRNMFGDPRPANLEELIEALDERELNPAECSALVDYADEGDKWFAEIIDAETGSSFSTLGYTEADDLKKDLKSAGFTDIVICS